MKDFIIRKKKGKTFTYQDKKGNPINKKTINKYLDFYIPPAYDDVKINKKNGKVKAIGIDDKHRSQYIYDPKYTNKRNGLKFSELIDFGKEYKNIYNKIQKDLYTTSETKDKQIATVLMLIIECDFRVGNDKYTIDNKSYGVTTLEKRHIKNKKGQVIIDFIGKKGVRNTCAVNDKKVINNLKKKKRTINKNDRIFSYRRGEKYYNIKSTDVNKYLKEIGNYSSKYFRTWSANISLITELKDGNDLKTSIEKTAFKLHHTPAICKKNYLDPKLINYYEKKQKDFFKFFNGDKDIQYYKFLKNNY
jgi:DNA topoisomerase-1